MLGAGACLHLSLWTLGWEGGTLPEHSLVLHAMAPLVAIGTRLLVQLGWPTTPRTVLGWGLASTGLGFALLVGALLVSWRVGRGRSDDAGEHRARGRSPLLA